MAPTSQNRLTKIPPCQSRLSARRSPMRWSVERRTLRSMWRFGAPSPLRGIAAAKSQLRSAKPSVSPAKVAGLPPYFSASAATKVPAMIAMKVAPSTSALPAGRSCTERWSGRMPYFTGPNIADKMPNSVSATKSTGIEWKKKPPQAIATAPNSASLRRRAMIALSKRSASWISGPECASSVG
jgi:hypothetical protein